MGSGHRKFVAGAVLTAAQVQNFLQDQTIMVYPTTAARDSTSSSGISSTELADGMHVFLQAPGQFARAVYDAGSTMWRVTDVWSTGGPEAVIAAPAGSMFHRFDGQPGVYAKELGAGTTGWRGLVGVEDTPAAGDVLFRSTAGQWARLAIGSSGEVLTASTSLLPAWATGSGSSGKVLQVVSTTKTDTFSESVLTTAESGDVTGLTQAITPSAASSKVLVRVSIAVGMGLENDVSATLYRDGTAILLGDAAGSRSRSAATGRPNLGDTAQLAFEFLDSPATTSAVTYSVRLRHGVSTTQTLYVNRSSDDSDNDESPRNASTITAEEIAA